MAAPEGNQFWKLRSKHGREKLFATPELLWDAATEYFEWCDVNPWNKTDFKGASVEKVLIPTARPYTLNGLCLYLDCSTSYFRAFKSTATEDVKDFITVIERIEATIYTQKFEGAVVGAFNANIIARDLGLGEKLDLTSKGEALNDLSNMSTDELVKRASAAKALKESE